MTKLEQVCEDCGKDINECDCEVFEDGSEDDY